VGPGSAVGERVVGWVTLAEFWVGMGIIPQSKGKEMKRIVQFGEMGRLLHNLFNLPNRIFTTL
jgi:hypothetical protein